MQYYIEHLEVLVARAKAERRPFLAFLLEMALSEASSPPRRRAKVRTAKPSGVSVHA